MLKIFIGPNGYGKTRKITDIKNKLLEDGVAKEDIFFLESEKLLMDEIKSTKDNTTFMEYFLEDLLLCDPIKLIKEKFEAKVDEIIVSEVANLNKMVTEVLSINETTKTGDFIEITKNKEYKKLVTVNNKDVKNLMGSGQKMLLILKLILGSSKKHVFLDEPELYSHPSLLQMISELIMQISESGKNLYVVTHSPKLVSMINIPLENIFILNDFSDDEKFIDFKRVVRELNIYFKIYTFKKNSTKYYDSLQINEIVKNLHYKDFIEAAFSKKVYLCEGINDELFIKRVLSENNELYSDYYIFKTFGKQHMPIFAKIFKEMGICVKIYFDQDKNNSVDKILAKFFGGFDNYMFVKNIEDELKYPGKKENALDFYEYIYRISINSTYSI